MQTRLIKQSAEIIEDLDTVYLKITGDCYISEKYQQNPFSRVKLKYSDNPNIPNIYDVPTHYITTSNRVIIENGWKDDLKNEVPKPSEYHPKKISMRFICDTQVAHDLYGEKLKFNISENNKIGNDIELIIPNYLDTEDVVTINEWSKNLVDISKGYNHLISNGWDEQKARSILPICLKTEITMTGFEDSWKELFNKTFSNPQTNALLKLAKEKILK